jgi:hypothetical protein
MKRFSFLLLAIPLLSIVSMAQAPSPSAANTPSPSINQAAAAPSPSPMAESRGIPILPAVVETFASGVMLLSVFGVLWLVLRTYTVTGYSIGPRHIQIRKRLSDCAYYPNTRA